MQSTFDSNHFFMVVIQKKRCKTLDKQSTRKSDIQKFICSRFFGVYILLDNLPFVPSNLDGILPYISIFAPTSRQHPSLAWFDRYLHKPQESFSTHLCHGATSLRHFAMFVTIVTTPERNIKSTFAAKFRYFCDHTILPFLPCES